MLEINIYNQSNYLNKCTYFLLSLLSNEKEKFKYKQFKYSYQNVISYLICVLKVKMPTADN